MTESGEYPLGRVIYFMAQDIRNVAEKVLAPYELTLEQFQVLKILSLERGLTQRQLGQETNKTPANMTRILDRLEGKSLVTRKTNPGDRRVYLIYLTDKGLSLFDDVSGVFELFSIRLHQGITKEMQQATRKVLEIMSANLTSMASEFQKLEEEKHAP